LEKKLELVRRLHRAGATLHIGTDFQPFVVPGWALRAEMRLFERATTTSNRATGFLRGSATPCWPVWACGRQRDGSSADRKPPNEGKCQKADGFAVEGSLRAPLGGNWFEIRTLEQRSMYDTRQQ